MKSISIEEILKIKDANIIDVRETYEFENGSLPGAINIPLLGLIMNANNFLDKEEVYYIICQGGGRSAQAYEHLNNQGYNVVQIEGGMSLYNSNEYFKM